MTHDPAESWRPVVGLEGLYEVSSKGDVRSFHTHGRGKRGGTMSAHIANGYHRLSLCDLSGNELRYAVHRLVAGAFIGPCPAGMEVNHKDGNKVNNAVGNLEYVTRAENIEHAKKLPTNQRGANNASSKLNDSLVRAIRRMAGAASRRDLGRTFGIHHSTVTRIVLGSAWKHVGPDQTREVA